MRKTKNQKLSIGKYDVEKEYDPKEAIKICKDISFANFDESVEVHYSLGIDPRHADQLVRGTMTLA